MNAVLDEILTTNSVSDGVATLPLRHPDFPNLPVHLDRAEGAFLQEIIADVRPRVSLEIGFAYGVSTLYMCEALSALDRPARHIVMDPFQSTQWRNIGLANIKRAGFGGMVEFHEEFSELLLPKLLESGTQIDVALVDGWHTFDQVMVEFYYLNRMLPVGGVIAFDDADRRSVNRVIRHVLTYPSYEVYPRRSSAGATEHITLAGRVRRAVAAAPRADRVFRADLLHRDWDLGILGSCVAIRKIKEDKRSSGWDRFF